MKKPDMECALKMAEPLADYFNVPVKEFIDAWTERDLIETDHKRMECLTENYKNWRMKVKPLFGGK